MFQSICKWGTGCWRILIAVLVITAMVPLQSMAEEKDTAPAEKKETAKEKLLRAYMKNIGKTEEFADSALKEIAKENAFQQKLKASIGGGFRGDETKGKDQFVLDATAKITIGQYPREIRVLAQSNVRYEDNKLKEDVRKMLLNYDYHFSRNFEIYSFVERFTDDYMSISDRYEIGLGFMYSTTRFDALGQKEKEMDNIRYLEDIKLNPLKNYVENNITDIAERNILQNFIRDAKRTRESVESRAARVSFGVAFTLFKELESAAIATTVYEPTKIDTVTNEVCTTQKKIDVESERVYRGVVRPTLRMKITDRIAFSGKWYFKWAIFNGNTHRIFQGEKKRDWRSDVYVNIEFKLEKGILFEEGTSLVLSVENHYDNTPPELSESLIETNNVKSPKHAVKEHTMYKLGVKISW